MSQTQSPAPVTLVDVLIALARHKRKIVLFPLVAGVLAAGVSLLMPNYYRASAVLLPPQPVQSSAAVLLSQFSGMVNVGGSGTVLKNPSDLYIGMLKSRTIADRLIARFNLKQVYGTDSHERAIQRLENGTQINSGKDGMIVIEVELKNKQLAAPLANAYAAELLAMTKTVAVTEAAQRRVFFERQLGAAKSSLAQAELNLKGALDTGGMISVDSDSRVYVETTSRLRAQIAAREIQLNSLGAFVTAENQEYQRVNAELGSLRSELAKLQNGRGPQADKEGDAERRSGLDNVKILRDVKYHQILYELLARQYEAARLDEAKDASIIQMLDPALEPEQQVRPKRIMLVLVSMLVALLAAIAYALGAEQRARMMNQPVRRSQLAALRSQLGWKR